MVFTLMTFVHSQSLAINSGQNLRTIRTSGVLLFGFVWLYMAMRPISGVFIDMRTYDLIFRYYQGGGVIVSTKDPMFHVFIKTCAQIMSAQAFFFLCATLYVLPAYYIAKKWFKTYWFYGFLILAGSFSFWAYGVNGIRNGIGTAMFLMALANKKRAIQILFLFLSYGFHKSMLLPIVGYVFTWFYNVPRSYFYFWVASIFLSLALPGFWEALFADMAEEDRLEYLLADAEEESFSRRGFRWDFLLYSATGVYAGYRYIFKEKIADKQYIQLYNVYLFANAFWILVIRAAFSNRFAYLSWFLLALVIVYPWLRVQFTPRQFKKLGLLLMAYYGFTYLMA